MKRVAKFQEGGEAEVEPPFVRRRQAREEAARAAEAEGDGRGARRERLRNFFRFGPRTQEEADILEAYRTNRDVREIRREREAGGRVAAPAPAPAPAAPTPAAPAPAAPSRGRQVQRPPRPAPATPAPTADYEERMQRGSLPAGRSATPGPMGDYSERAAAGAAARPRSAQRQAPRSRMSEADRLNQMELDRIEQDRIDEARRGLREDADRRANRGFFERLGLRRTNETGMEPGTEARMRDMYGSQYSSQYNMKQGGMIKAYREGGPIRQGMQSPRAQEARAEMAEDVMRRAREPISDKDRKAARVEANMDRGPLTEAEKERMRASGFKKGGAIKPKAKTAMKKGGAVKAPAKKMKAGGKVAPKKMMKGGIVAKPKAKKMMGGGRAMYAKGGMARGCK